MANQARRLAARMRRRVALSGSPMHRSIALVCVTAMVVSGATATAASLITGKNVKNGSLTGADIKKKSIPMGDLSKSTQTMIRKGLTSPTSLSGGSAPGNQGESGSAGAAGANGTNGANGTAGANGANGANGADGADSQAPRPVTAEDLQGFQLLPRGTNPDPSDNGEVSFVVGPDLPPLGTGSLRLLTNNGKNVTAVVPLRAGNDKPKISELTTATYSAYVANQTGSGDVALKIVVTGANACPNANPCTTPSASGFTTIVYEPSNNLGTGPNQNASIADHKWQRWNVRGGKVYSTRALVSGKCQNTSAGLCTIDDLIADSPQAQIEQVRLEVGQNSGAGFAGFDSNTDDVRLGFDGDFLRYDLGD